MNPFEAATAEFEKDHAVASPESNKESAQTEQAPQSVAEAMAELEKFEKFKFKGQEWTPSDLEKAIMRQKDYTQKTQTLATDRKSLEDERKYYENLAWDLMAVRQNPALAKDFVATYPEKFHRALEEMLKTGQVSSNTPSQEQKSVQSSPPVDVNLLSRLDRLEKFYNDQEVQKNEAQIQSKVETFSKKYPDAANFKEMVLGRAYESHMQGVQLTDEVWENIFKQVNDEVSGVIKAKYGELVKKQTEANAKSRDVGSGGGVAGQAPKKFSKLSDVTQFAIDDLTGRGR